MSGIALLIGTPIGLTPNIWLTEFARNSHLGTTLRFINDILRVLTASRDVPQAACPRRSAAQRRGHPGPRLLDEPPAQPRRHGVLEARAVPDIDPRQRRLCGTPPRKTVTQGNV